MKEDASFLPFLIDEEIYVVNEHGTAPPVTPETHSGNAKDTHYQYSGSTLVIIEEQDQSSLSDKHYEFLIRILKSVHLDTDKVQFIYGQEADNLHMENLEKCTVIAFSGNPPDSLWQTTDQKRYVIQSVKSNALLLADPLGKIYEDKAVKRQLWECLKVMYRIS